MTAETSVLCEARPDTRTHARVTLEMLSPVLGALSLQGFEATQQMEGLLESHYPGLWF